MAKIFETDAEIVDLAETVYGETGLAQMGFTLKVMSVTKSKDSRSARLTRRQSSWSTTLT